VGISNWSRRTGSGRCCVTLMHPSAASHSRHQLGEHVAAAVPSGFSFTWRHVRCGGHPGMAIGGCAVGIRDGDTGSDVHNSYTCVFQRGQSYHQLRPYGRNRRTLRIERGGGPGGLTSEVKRCKATYSYDRVIRWADYVVPFVHYPKGWRSQALLSSAHHPPLPKITICGAAADGAWGAGIKKRGVVVQPYSRVRTVHS
jgi:hypothetical protein